MWIHFIGVAYLDALIAVIPSKDYAKHPESGVLTGRMVI